MLGNKRPSVVSGRLNFPVRKKVAPLPGWIDKESVVVEGISGLQESMPKRRFVDLSNVPVPRPTGPRADKKNQNKKVETSRWVASSYVTLDNQLYNFLDTTVTPALTYQQYNKDYQYADVVLAPDDVSKVGANMWSAPIGLRVMQQHFGARAGASVGPYACVSGKAPVYGAANYLVDGSVPDGAWAKGVMFPSGPIYGGSQFIGASDIQYQLGSANTGSMWFNQIGIQWCPIGVNHLDKNDFEKLSEYKYFRFKKFGMRITIDGDTFYKSKKNNMMTSYQYAAPYANMFGGSATGHSYTAGGIKETGVNALYGEASLDLTRWSSDNASGYNVTRAGPRASCTQPYGTYEYMIIGPERLQQLDLPGLMGMSDKPGAKTDGMGCIHVWDTLREHGIPVHKAKKNVIDISWKPYSVNIKEDPASIGVTALLDQTTAGPYGPVVEMADLNRTSNSAITPFLFSTGAVNTMTALRNLPLENGYPYVHIGPVVLIRFAADPGVSCQLMKIGTGATDQATSTVVNPISATVPYHVKCWSTYEAFGEDFDTFDVTTTDMWKAPTYPTVWPIHQGAAGDGTNVG